jgi:hypothetical protein
MLGISSRSSCRKWLYDARRILRHSKWSNIKWCKLGCKNKKITDIKLIPRNIRRALRKNYVCGLLKLFWARNLYFSKNKSRRSFSKSMNFKFMVPCILNNGNFIQLDDTVLFWYFYTHSTYFGYLSPIFRSDTANWSSWYNNIWVGVASGWLSQ